MTLKKARKLKSFDSFGPLNHNFQTATPLGGFVQDVVVTCGITSMKIFFPLKPERL